MLSNIESRDNLRALARAKTREYDLKTIANSKLDDHLAKGWTIDKKNDATVRVKRKKTHDKLLEDRVWALLYKMGFLHLSIDGGGFLLLNAKDPTGPNNQIDVVGIDEEVALAIECKSAEKRSSRPQFQEELAKHVGMRERFVQAINKGFATTYKRPSVFIMFTSNISLSENDKKRADEAKVVILDEVDLQYYENLVMHIGPAAKYQFFADILSGRKVPGLEIKIPAIKTKMGGTNCYTFSISAEYLLKIAYIAHRSKGKASDVNTYQRMISRSRLAKIRKYVGEKGIFPTNIVLNLDQRVVQFDKIGQEYNGNHDIENGLLGWLTIRPWYKCAWIIDGQHRLFAYSGLEWAQKSKLSVLAFEGLLPSKQAQLFVDINAKQKSVKQSLLQELYAELHWDAADAETRVRAILSKAVQDLGSDPDSPLYNRIQTADASKDNIRCITLSSVFGALEKTGFHISKTKSGAPIEYGPLWEVTNDKTLKRTVYILKCWLNDIRAGAPDWWDKGSADGGGLAMNDGVITCLNVLRSVFQHLDGNGAKLLHLDNEDLYASIKPYAKIVGEYFGSLTEEERKRFRDLRGSQGQTTRTRRCQQAIRERKPNFNPQGLDDFIKLEKAQTNQKAKEIIDWIETTMQKAVLEEVRQHFGPSDSEWWVLGVPKPVRLKVTERSEQDDNKRGGKEFYFDLMDYRKIIVENWDIFETMFAYKKSGNKEARTSWMAFVNERRNIVSHPSSAITLSLEDLAQLEDYKSWLMQQLQGNDFLETESEVDQEAI